ncbi:hypothetical protein [Roseomonas indoligenes]|uniref:Uncharacterized protein n=1 Tax=Roseomonas indoligenes TaxID=2820811 RepID=A0A940MYZ4_9PROT|nr:hypothetical protein [Pararoseomonas indoligenes]MBP0493650.1 hypothetical protein [Pararoseomonas indoligenes]
MSPLTRPLTLAMAFLALSVGACTAPSPDVDAAGKYPDELYADDARASADAIAAGMERARRDLARRAIMRMFRDEMSR